MRVVKSGRAGYLREKLLPNVLQGSLAKLRKGRPVPAPCKSCGKGVQSEIHRCRKCGRERVRQHHIGLEKKTRIQFDLVLDQLIAKQTI